MYKEEREEFKGGMRQTDECDMEKSGTLDS